MKALVLSLNSILIRYDPYSKVITREYYDFDQMKETRQKEIAKSSTPKINTFGIILGTLGRQGSCKILENLKMKLTECNKEYIIILMSEIFPQKLKMFNNIDAYAYRNNKNSFIVY